MDRSYGARKLKSMKKHKSSRLIPSISHLILNLLTASMCILVCSTHFLLPSSSLESYVNHFLSVTLPHIKSTFLHPKCLFIVINAIVVFLIGESRLRASPSSPADDLYAEYVDRVSRGKNSFKVYAPSPKKKNRFEVYDPIPKNKNNKERDSEMKNNKEREANKDFINEDHGVEEVAAEVGAEVGTEGMRKLLEKGKERDSEMKKNNKEREANNNFINEDRGVEEVGAEVGAGVGTEGIRKLLEKGKDEEKEKEEEEELPAEELKRRVEAFIARVNKRRWLEARSSICADA